MSAEDQEILARIGQLAGQINRHKSQQAGSISTPSNQFQPQPWRGAKSWQRGGAPYPSRGFRGGMSSAHRNRTLVLNGAGQTSRSSDTESGPDASQPSWITKSDRHLQLINTSVYEKETQARTKAIEQTRQQRLALKNQRERAKLTKHLDRLASIGGNDDSSSSSNKYEISVEGINFLVVKNGSKLVKAPGDNNAAKATPKMAVIGGVKFYRSKNGNLYRHGIVKAQRRSGVVKKVNVPCRMFSTTGISLSQTRYFDHSKLRQRYGSCAQGPRCRYIHDPSRVAACKDFLQKGECANGDECDLSHELTPERTPTCVHFVKDNCTNSGCRYAHVKVSPAVLVCRPFGIYGYCEKGAACAERHAFECPDFSNTGICKTKGCKLLHRERASVLRKAANATVQDQRTDVDMDDLSSDEDGDSVDSNDVDSDEVEEFIGEEDGLDFVEGKDYIQL